MGLSSASDSDESVKPRRRIRSEGNAARAAVASSGSDDDNERDSFDEIHRVNVLVG
jgi:hypothetical protein